jgi:hypothetical protein
MMTAYQIQKDIGDKLDSVLHFSDLQGGESILFVFADDTTDLLDQAAVLCGEVAEDVVPLFLKRRELFQLAIPFPGPRQPPGTAHNFMSRGSFHTAAWAKYRSAVVYGHDIRPELLLPKRTVRSLRHHLEIGSDIVRESAIMSGLTFQHSLIREVGKVMAELMLSALLAIGDARWTREEIESRFREVAPQMSWILDELRELEAQARESPDSYCEAHEYRAAWLYERFLIGLGELANGLSDDAEESGSSRARYQRHGEKLMPVNGGQLCKNSFSGADINPSFFGLKEADTAVYYEAIEAGIDDLREVRDAIISLVFYGSMARQSLRPGKSDMCDAYLVLDDKCFQDYDDFQRVFRAMVQSSRKMNRAGGDIPFHPFKYTSASDWSYRHPPMFHSEWESDLLSRIAFGDDIRGYTASSSAGVSCARRALFALPSLSRRCAGFLRKEELNLREMAFVLKTLASGIKMIPRWLCAACDIWANNETALKHLAEIAPSLDLSPVNGGDNLPIRSSGEVAVRQALDALRRMLELVDQASDAAMTWLESHDELGRTLDI